MINDLEKRNGRRQRRALRVRKALKGTAEKPRLSVFKSNQHLFAQLIDDEKGFTLASAGTVMKELRDRKLGKKSKSSAKAVGTKLAEVAKQKGILRVAFDRGFNKYHGLLAEVASAARESGLQF